MERMHAFLSLSLSLFLSNTSSVQSFPTLCASLHNTNIKIINVKCVIVHVPMMFYYEVIPQISGPVLVKEYSQTATVASPHHACFSPTPLVCTSQSSRGSNASTLDCSLVVLKLMTQHFAHLMQLPVLTESNTPMEVCGKDLGFSGMYHHEEYEEQEKTQKGSKGTFRTIYITSLLDATWQAYSNG